MMMKRRVTIFALVSALVLNSGGSVWAAEQESEEEYGKDSAAGLPGEYGKHYLVAKATMSPDEKFAVIYPTLEFSESKEAKNFLVALKPFKVLATLPTDELYFQDQSHGGVGADWSSNGSSVLITFDGKWGPRDVFLVDLADDKVKRITNMLEKLRELLRPKFRTAKPRSKAYNDGYEFIFEEEEGGACTFEGSRLVKSTRR
jgi:hypothetical protein